MFLETQISFLESRKTVEIRDFFPFLLPPLHPSSTSGRKVCFVPSEAETIFHLRGDLENGFLSLHVFKVFSLSLALSLSIKVVDAAVGFSLDQCDQKKIAKGL